MRGCKYSGVEKWHLARPITWRLPVQVRAPQLCLEVMYWVYILQSEVTGRYYIGQTNNLEDRIWRHNQGEVLSTKAHRPWKQVYSESFNSRSKGVGREHYLKSLKNRSYLEKIINMAG